MKWRKEERFLRKILRLSERVYADGDNIRSQHLDNLMASIEAAEKKTRQNPGSLRNKFLYVALAASYAMFACPRRKGGRIEKHLDHHAKRKPRTDGNPSIPYVRLILPLWDRRSHSRFGKALVLAFEQKMSPTEFVDSIGDNRGVVKFIEHFGD